MNGRESLRADLPKWSAEHVNRRGNTKKNRKKLES
jgi:hypothetical protein